MKLSLPLQMERENCSGSNSSGDAIWAKLVSLDSSYSDIELRSNDVKMCSEMKSSSCEKQEWCKITRANDQISASLQNKSHSSILVDGIAVQEDDVTIIRCGSEIILGPEADGFRRYKFKVMRTEETCEKPLKIIIDPQDAKCSICLSVWHDVVTVSPCLHNFCNGCFSKWLERCQEKGSSVVCPQCRSVVQFVGRNHFLHSIEEGILKSDSSLRRSDEEIARLDSYSSIKLPLVSNASSLSLVDQQKLARVEQRLYDMEMTLRSYASHANIDFSSLGRLGPPPPLPNTDEPMDTDNEDDDEEEYMYDEEEEDTGDEEEEHMDDEEEEHADDDEQ